MYKSVYKLQEFIKSDGVLENKLDSLWEHLPQDKYCHYVTNDTYIIGTTKFRRTIRIAFLLEQIDDILKDILDEI